MEFALWMPFLNLVFFSFIFHSLPEFEVGVGVGVGRDVVSAKKGKPGLLLLAEIIKHVVLCTMRTTRRQRTNL